FTRMCPAQRALARRAQPRDGFLRAYVAPVGLECDADAAERLEAVAEEEVLRLGVRRRARELAREKRRADFDLTVGRPHVEQSRRADRAAGGVPHLRVDDRLAARHRVLPVAYQRERVVERPRLVPGEIAADFSSRIASKMSGAYRSSSASSVSQRPFSVTGWRATCGVYGFRLFPRSPT